ncbi:hypothetical protein FQA39_LY13550 [Lamprigera yunnana]|nr:hypothetical protein FQA39_LY13550 [Lamprigera yunnana]
MVRSAIADDTFLHYLSTLIKDDSPTVGLILGQPTPTKDYIVHFARTPLQNELGEKAVKKIADLSEIWIADHARHATRMLPGGMYILGIFIVSEEDIMTTLPKLKSILVQLKKKLTSNEFLYGVPSHTNDKLVLCYSKSTHSYACKNYNYETDIVNLADLKFQQKLSVKWLQLECRYELDQIFPIDSTKANWVLKKHMNDILKSINDNLRIGVFFFDGEMKDDTDILESIGKKKMVHSKLGQYESNDVKLIQVTILLPNVCITSRPSMQIIDCKGQIKLAGHVATKLWLHPNATVKDTSTAIIEDIVRSLAARLEMHWDSLIEEEHGSAEDTNSIHETPRRVIVNLPSSKVTLTDYLFPGEGPQEAQISLKELLDIEIAKSDSILDVEGQADLTDLGNEGIEINSEDMLQKLPKTTNKYIYFTGLGVATLVLIISVFIHFIQN